MNTTILYNSQTPLQNLRIDNIIIHLIFVLLQANNKNKVLNLRRTVFDD